MKIKQIVISIFKKEKKLNKRWWYLIWPVVVGISLGLGFIFWKSRNANFELLSPLAGSPLSFLTGHKEKKEVIGFLPYWTVKDFEPGDFKHLPFTQIAYFGLSLDSQGNFIYHENGERELGAFWLQGKTLAKIFENARKAGVKNLLVVKSFDNQTIDSVITEASPSARAIENITAKVMEYNLDGVNIDFEYILEGKMATNSAQKLVEFSDRLNKRLEEEKPGSIVSIDIYPNGFFYNEPYDVIRLSQVCDQIILMAYDFHQMGSAKAGPVAPMRAPLGSRSITDTLQMAFEKKVPSQKLILGIPLYGYEWQTVSGEHQANTYPRSGVLATYKRVKELVAEKRLFTFWDNLAMSPWLIYKDEGKTQQIYFENDRSIGLKLELTKQAELGGIAFWAIGYEGGDRQFWQIIKNWQEKY